MRTRTTLAAIATNLAALRLSGVTIRAIALSQGASVGGIHDLLARIGLAGLRPPRSRLPVTLTRRAAEAVALLTHPCVRRLTWRQRVVLQGSVRGMATRAIASELGLTVSRVRSVIATARRRLRRTWRRRSRAKRPPAANLADLLTYVDDR